MSVLELSLIIFVCRVCVKFVPVAPNDICAIWDKLIFAEPSTLLCSSDVRSVEPLFDDFLSRFRLVAGEAPDDVGDGDLLCW